MSSIILGIDILNPRLIYFFAISGVIATLFSIFYFLKLKLNSFLFIKEKLPSKQELKLQQLFPKEQI